jgi:lipopolysaccharide export system protein LptA
VELIDAVRVERTDAKGRPTILTTSRLTVFPNREYAQTDQAVRIEAANGVTTARNESLLNDGRMLLLSNVRGQHEASLTTFQQHPHSCSSLAMLLGSPVSWALPSDRDQPIRVQADSAELDEKQGVAVYRGGVVITQGTLKITGDKVTITQDARGDIEVFTAEGNLAYYEQLPAEDKSIVKAYGLTIQYFAPTERIVLIDQARVIQEGNTFKGEKIVYDTASQIVQAGRATGWQCDQAAAAGRHGHPAEEETRGTAGALMATLKAQHLAKSYKGRQVVRDVSLTIESGQIVGLLGPNGAGKTTCFYMIVGLVRADQGRDSDRRARSSATHPCMAAPAPGSAICPRKPRSFASSASADNIMAILETRKELTATAVSRHWKACWRSFTSTTSATTLA